MQKNGILFLLPVFILSVFLFVIPAMVAEAEPSGEIAVPPFPVVLTDADKLAMSSTVILQNVAPELPTLEDETISVQESTSPNEWIIVNTTKMEAIETEDEITIDKTEITDITEIPEITDATETEEHIDSDWEYLPANTEDNGITEEVAWEEEVPVITSETDKLSEQVEETEETESKEAIIQSTEYPMYYLSENEDTEITITQEEFQSSVCYVAHIETAGQNPFQTEYAHGEWNIYRDTGSGFTTGETASSVAERLDCLFLVNGDFRDAYDGSTIGIVRNGEVINDTTTLEGTIAITENGNIIPVGKTSTNNLQVMNVSDTFYFGPLLINHGEILNDGDFSDWDTCNINPRTLIGQIYHNDNAEASEKEYYIVVVDGRQTGYSEGLTLYDCAVLMQNLGCDIAYNLDGGGSSEMIFNGNILNSPSGGGERLNCDFIYIQ